MTDNQTEELDFLSKVMPKVYLDFEKRIREFETRDDDVWVASFPKCGE